MSKPIPFQPKKNGDHVRQGDVLVIYTPGVKLGAKLPHEGGAAVLAHGEVTGHSHQLPGSTASLYALEDNRVTGESAIQAIARLGGGLIPDRGLEMKRSAALKHEEHDHIKLPAGSYTVRIQREYSPAELRNVAD